MDVDVTDTAAEILTIKLKAWATQLAARFGAPVLLVGSALRKLHPRDVDVRIVIPDEEFEARYGVTWDRWSRGVDAQRWIDDMAKLGRNMVLTYKINLDLQVHAAGYIDAHNLAGPAVVLAAPSGDDLAGGQA